MKNLNKKIFILALIISIITAYLTYGYLKSLQKDTKIKTKNILVAAQDIQPGQKISINMIKDLEVNQDSYIKEGINNKSELVNQIVREKIYKGETIPQKRLIKEGELHLPFLIPEGKRAISIVIDEFSGVADLIQPNDFVDIYVTVEENNIDTNDSVIVYPQTSILLLQNIQVMAISKQTIKKEEQRIDTPSKYAVTLAVSASDGEKMILGEEIGNIKLALRGVGDDSIHLTPGVVRQDLVTEKGKVVLYK